MDPATASCHRQCAVAVLIIAELAKTAGVAEILKPIFDIKVFEA